MFINKKWLNRLEEYYYTNAVWLINDNTFVTYSLNHSKNMKISRKCKYCVHLNIWHFQALFIVYFVKFETSSGKLLNRVIVNKCLWYHKVFRFLMRIFSVCLSLCLRYIFDSKVLKSTPCLGYKKASSIHVIYMGHEIDHKCVKQAIKM